MTIHLPLNSTLAVVVVLLTMAILASPAASPASGAPGTLPENTINISFDLARSSMTGTAKIILPPKTPLELYYGQLEITGSILETTGKTPRTLQSTGGNSFIIPQAADEQTLYVSWSLVADGMNDNLISDRGITLAGLWHPLPDIDMAYRLEARLPEGFTAVSEGETVAYCLDKFNRRSLTTSFDHPIRAIHFAAGPYTVQSRTLPGDIILSAFFFEEDLALADEYLDRAESYLALYQEMIGPYPYSRYSIVENRLPTGYGMPTFTLLGQAVVRLPFIKDTSLGHEILHSWFGNSIQTTETGGNWSEGLTTYLADYFYAEQAGKGAEYRKDQLLRYASYVHQDNDVTLQNFSNPGHSQPLARKVRAVGYDKSSMVFHMLRRQLGDDLFFQGVQAFSRKFSFSRAGWDEIEETFAEISGRDLSIFFDQWLTRWDIPQLAVDEVDITQVNGQSKISLTLEQKSLQPYSLAVPITVKTGSAEVRETFTITEQSQDIEIIVEALPLEMTIDPEYDLMRTLTGNETPPLWSRFIGAEKKTVVLPPSAAAGEIYAPLLPILEDMGCEMSEADELTNEDLAQGSFLFLGTSRHSLGLFADPAHSVKGVTIDVRENPLAPEQIMVLVTSPDREQTRSVARKLSHYGKYSFLYFENGQAMETTIAQSDQGIRVNLFPAPKAIRVPDIRSFDDIIHEIKNSRVIYVGEMHTDLGDHILQLQVIQALFAEYPGLAIGMEMFPNTSQEVLDQYIDGTIETENEFIKKSKYFDVWGFDYRYYRDIIGYARRNGIPLVGLNIEKSIVSQVFREGHLDGLDETRFNAIPTERKLDSPGYRQRLSTAFSSHDQKSFTADKISGFIQAQSIWDETMAETIVSYLSANPERKMVVIAGNGHVYKDSAIPGRVARRMDVPQSVLSSINAGTTGLVPGYQVDYLVYTEPVELEPAAKIGVVLETEKIDDESEKTRLRVVRISPHGKALEAGVKEKDLILTLDGRQVEDITDIRIILLDKRPGDTAIMKVLRQHLLLGDELLELEVELSSPMQFGAMPPAHPK